MGGKVSLYHRKSCNGHSNKIDNTETFSELWKKTKLASESIYLSQTWGRYKINQARDLDIFVKRTSRNTKFKSLKNRLWFLSSKVLSKTFELDCFSMNFSVGSAFNKRKQNYTTR